VAVEFILILPLLLFLFWGMFSLSMAILMKMRLSDAAWTAARTCTSRSAPTPAGSALSCPNVGTVINTVLGNARSNCQGSSYGLQVDTKFPVSGNTQMRYYSVNVSCRYVGNLNAISTLLPNFTLTVNAASPF
jgi:Flp pilus assembly protein TadG